MTIEDRLTKVIKETLEQPENHRREPVKIAPTARFIEDLQCDSLDLIEVLLAVEEEFELDVPDEDTANIHTVQDAIDYLTKHVKE